MHSSLLSISAAALLTATISLTSAAFAGPGHSHDHSLHTHKDGPHFYGHIDGLIHADSIYDADEADEEFDEVYAHIDAHVGFAFNDNFSVESVVKLEGESALGGHSHGSSSGPDGNNLYFDDHPLIVEQLLLNYETDDFAMYGGKFNPVVGLDYHAVQQVIGIWTYQKLEEYAIRERLGVGGAYKVNGGDYGQHRLDVSSFFADTTLLSGSLLSTREELQKDDGGVSNTENFKSFAVSLGGTDFYSLNLDFVEDLSYRLGYAHQAAGESNDDDENRFSATLGYNPQFTQNLALKSFIEYVNIQHLDGEADHDRGLFTAAAALHYKGWNTAVSNTSIMNKAGDPDESQNGYIFQVSSGYRIQQGPFQNLGFDLGWKTQEEEGEERDTLGGMLSFKVAF